MGVRLYVRCVRTHVACTCVRTKMSRLIFNPRSSEESLLVFVSAKVFAYIAAISFLTERVKSVPRVTFRTLILSLPFNNFAAYTRFHSNLHSLSLSLFAFLSPFLSLTLLSLSLFPLCTLAVCLTDPLDLTWHKQQSLCKKGTIFVKRNSLARDTLILFSAKHTDLYRMESIDENISSACDHRFSFTL